MSEVPLHTMNPDFPKHEPDTPFNRLVAFYHYSGKTFFYPEGLNVVQITTRFTEITTRFVPRTLGRVGLEQRCPPRQNSRVERLKVEVEPLLT